MTLANNTSTDGTALRIGLFGFGCVGQGLYDVLRRTPGLRAQVARICVKDRSKPRTLPLGMFMYDRGEILGDDTINVVVELIDDANAAFDIVSSALRAGKAVVSANKRMIAERFDDLLAIQNETGSPFLYEASVCGSIPIIRNLEEYYDNDLLDGLEGIVNGTTNFILTRVSDGEGAYEGALASAQRLGFAESDPTLDVEGYDAVFKTVILAAHGFGVVVKPGNIVRRGITTVSSFDAAVAKRHGYTIKLVSSARLADGEVSASVLPTFVRDESPLASVRDEYNAVSLHAAFSDAQLMVGKGAGGHPTASAVLSDIAALRYAYRYEYKKIAQGLRPRFSQRVPIKIYARSSRRDLLEQIPWSTIEIEHRSPDGSYVIGTTVLDELSASEAFRSDETFIAKVV